MYYIVIQKGFKAWGGVLKKIFLGYGIKKQSLNPKSSKDSY